MNPHNIPFLESTMESAVAPFKALTNGVFTFFYRPDLLEADVGYLNITNGSLAAQNQGFTVSKEVADLVLRVKNRNLLSKMIYHKLINRIEMLLKSTGHKDARLIKYKKTS